MDQNNLQIEEQTLPLFEIKTKINGLPHTIQGTKYSNFQVFGFVDILDSNEKVVMNGFSINNHIYNAKVNINSQFEYEGSLVNFSPHGYGVLSNLETNIDYAGDFLNGIMYGKGYVINKENNSCQKVTYDETGAISFHSFEEFRDFEQKCKNLQLKFQGDNSKTYYQGFLSNLERFLTEFKTKNDFQQQRDSLIGRIKENLTIQVQAIETWITFLDNFNRQFDQKNEQIQTVKVENNEQISDELKSNFQNDILNLGGKVELKHSLIKWLNSGQLQTCKELKLWNMQIDAKFALEFSNALVQSKCSGLQCLYLQNNHISNEGAVALSRALIQIKCSQLRSLYLYSNFIGSEGAVAIANSIIQAKCSQLQELYFLNNYIGNQGAAAIANAFILAKCSSLLGLDLSKCDIGNQGAIEVANALIYAKCSKLRTLHLYFNNIGNEGATALAKALTQVKCTQLLGLYLSNNNIGNDGACAIANAIIHGKYSQLQELYLSNNKIGNAGAIAIANSIKEARCTQLLGIYLSNNDIGKEGAAALQKSLHNVCNLATLDLDNNNFVQQKIEN